MISFFGALVMWVSRFIRLVHLVVTFIDVSLRIIFPFLIG